MPDWQQIVAQHGPAGWRTAYRLLGNRADADECLQESFLAALAVSERETVENWQALLTRLATSRAIDRLRSRDRRRQREEIAVSCSTRSVDAPEQQLVERELADELRRSLVRLPANQAQAFCLHCLEDWSYQDIAAQLNVSVNAVGTLVHRARKQLRALMAGFAPERTERSQQNVDGGSVHHFFEEKSQ